MYKTNNKDKLNLVPDSAQNCPLPVKSTTQRQHWLMQAGPLNKVDACPPVQISVAVWSGGKQSSHPTKPWTLSHQLITLSSFSPD